MFTLRRSAVRFSQSLFKRNAFARQAQYSTGFSAQEGSSSNSQSVVLNRRDLRLKRARDAVETIRNWQTGDDIPLQEVMDINALPANEYNMLMDEISYEANNIPDIDLTAKGDPTGLYDPNYDPDGKEFQSSVKEAFGENYSEDMYHDFIDLLKLQAKQSEQLARLHRNHRTPVNESWYEPPLVRIHEKNPNPLEGLAHNRPGEDEQTDGEWFASATDFQSLRGVARSEYLDPTLWDDLLPEVVDTTLGAGSSIFNPIVVQSHGETYRVTGCYGDCGDSSGRDLDDETLEIQWFRLYENQYSLCIDCGLWFYCACPKTVAQMKVNTLLLEDEDVLREYLEVNARNLIDQGKLSESEAEKLIEEDMDIVDQNIRLKNKTVIDVMQGKYTHWEADAKFQEGAKIPTLAAELYEIM